MYKFEKLKIYWIILIFFFHYNNNRLLIKKVEIYIYLHSANVNILVSKKIIKYYNRIIIKNYKIYHIGYNIMQSIFFKMIEIVKKFDLFVSLSRIIWSFSVSNSIFFFFFFFILSSLLFVILQHITTKIQWRSIS